MSDKPLDLKLFERNVGEYEEVKPVYDVFRRVLKEILSRVVKDLGVLGIVQARAKEIPSFAEKSIRKQDEYPHPLEQFPDLCGARIITEYKDEIEPVCAYIQKHFEIDEREDVLERLGAGEFGYTSVHFVVSLKRGEFEDLLGELQQAEPTAVARAEFKKRVERLYERRTQAECEAKHLPPGPRFRAEIQVRTLLQHAWAAFYHDRVYKAEFEVPRRWQRDGKRIAAALKEADESIARTIRGVEGYKGKYGAYMSREKREQEVEKLEAVFRHDLNNRRLAHRIARLALTLEDWPRARDKLLKFVAKWEESPAGKALKNAAAIISKEQDANKLERAQEQLEDLQDPETAAVVLDFGWATWQDGEETGRDYIKWAIELDQNNIDAPLVLADTYINEDVDTALEYYERAFKAAPSEPRALAGYFHCKLAIDRNLNAVSLLRPSLEAAIQECRKRVDVGLELPRAFYEMGFFALFLGRPYESLNAYARGVQLSDSESDIDRTLKQIKTLQRSLGGVLPELEWVRRFMLAAKVAKMVQAKNKAESADEVCLTDLVPSDLPPFENPIMIIAGGCDKRIEDRIQEYRSLLEMAFQDFCGTVFSGGTVSGIAGLVGDLPASSKGPITKLTYLPNLPPWTKVHDAYTVCSTGNLSFSALEPIQNWIDLLASGIDPADVKLLGINGGKIAGFEYRMALAMGAKVGILRDSGRAATEIFEDAHWKDSENLLMLPTEAQTVRAFADEFPPSKCLDRERLAREAHEEYRKEREKDQLAKNPEMADWEHLPSDLQFSNLQQIDHIEAKLRAINKGIRKVETGTIPLVEFTPEEIETMAQMEHGRWNAERLLRGWRLGKKNVEKKLSPYLVAWSDLPGEIKGYDLDPVRKIPQMLKDEGYEIVPAAESDK